MGGAQLARSSEGFCPDCFEALYGYRCRRRSCPGYAPIWARDQEARVKANISAWDGDSRMLTVSAPGKDSLPWDLDVCRHLGRHTHEGPRGCRVGEGPALIWNQTAPDRLSALHKAAIQALRRDLGSRAASSLLLLGYVPQYQERGVLHYHLAVGWKGAKGRRAFGVYCEYMRRRLARYGFGRQFDTGRRFANAQAMAGYMARYIARRRGELVKIVTSQFAPARPVYVSPYLTKRTGITMRFRRFSRWLWHAWGDVDLSDQLLAFGLHRELGAVPEFASETPARGSPNRDGQSERVFLP